MLVELFLYRIHPCNNLVMKFLYDVLVVVSCRLIVEQNITGLRSPYRFKFSAFSSVSFLIKFFVCTFYCSDVC